jgi:DNA processing protein
VNEKGKYRVALSIALAGNLAASKKISRNFPDAADVFKATKKELNAAGLEPEIVEELTSPEIFDLANKEIDWVEKNNYTVLSFEDERYPDYLREIFDPPFVLYCAGQTETLKETAVSVVGARKPTPYGKAVAEKLARDLASAGIVVVSGLARGIDSTAHWGALKGGKTVAVLGSGLDYIYPKENKSLFKKIIERGAVVTEFPRKSPPLAFHFPQRNRIISGLSLAVVAVEAAKRSGSLISARLALEQNREVMAVPGNITSGLSQGTNWLIKTGAKLVEDWKDVVEEFPSPLKEKFLAGKKEKKEGVPSLTAREQKIIEHIKTDTLTHIDEIVEKSELSVAEILSLLLDLELKGLIVQSPGKYFQRKL